MPDQPAGTGLTPELRLLLEVRERLARLEERIERQPEPVKFTTVLTSAAATAAIVLAVFQLGNAWIQGQSGNSGKSDSLEQTVSLIVEHPEGILLP